ncbi:GtrA family protein [Vibrio sp. JC009]|uniref:GtrA family protein n=1 Tax=Vibrio sp. JC009 TaxID=2912314 RepID=UPI0023B0F995|nr:GtrA family protein [Vibrio sp. JC009]WED24245.1 GtrA family protein [Vibrio sp. JC009]
MPLIPERTWNSHFFRFAIVGGVGFVVDSAVFAILFYLLGIPVFYARILSFICAATSTWMGNRLFTFGSRDGNLFQQWLRFFTSACISAIPNFTLFSGIIFVFGEQGLIPYIALVFGTLAGMFSNFFLAKKWVFARKNDAS